MSPEAPFLAWLIGDPNMPVLRCNAVRTVRSPSEIGVWMQMKYRDEAKKHGHRHVAHRLKKQGVPLEITRLILLGK